MNPTPALMALVCLLCLCAVAIVGYNDQTALMEQVRAEKQANCDKVKAMNNGIVPPPFETYCSNY
jgi:hypothetical protein